MKKRRTVSTPNKSTQSLSLIPPRRITTSALDPEATEALAERIKQLDRIKSARPHDAPLSPSEELPLDLMESVIGLRAQGDAHRNDLELLYDRIMGVAPAPLHTPPSRQSAPKTLLAPPRALCSPQARGPQDPYQPPRRRALQTLDTLDESGVGMWGDGTLDTSLDDDDSASGWS